MKKLRFVLEYMLILIVINVFGYLPLSMSKVFWQRIGMLLYQLLPSLSKVVRNNIRETIGKNWDEQKVEELVKKTFEVTGRHVAEFCVMAVRPQYFFSRTPVKGKEVLQNTLELGRAAVLVSGHFSNWEMLSVGLYAQGFKVHAIYKQLSNPFVDRLMVKIRKGYGYGLIEMKDYKRGQKVFEKNEFLGLISDQDARHHGIFIDFLEKPASTYVGPALFALRNEVPLIACLLEILPGGEYCLEVRKIEPRFSQDEAMEKKIAILTQAWVKALEEKIRKYPEEYFWFHRRWKTSPSDPSIS